ncbi:hypothetical protein EZS27_013512 [termite gut metagenome]|uniref:DUF4361 domain-containing protein n=1 Tax=termite gut metagenome TaxID=433724 RepID=A0A5J4RXJ8_9ZZZZ
MKYPNIPILALLLLGTASCNRDEVFEKEQYKNVFALISEGSDNVIQKFHDLRETESIGYISVSLGGTNPTAKNIVIDLTEDESLIDNYNKVNYDVAYDKYVHVLSKSKYDIDQYRLTIPTGQIKAVLPFRIRPEGLSPDSTYFLALKVDSYSTYEANPEKSYLLYSVRLKNLWAKGDGNTNYTMRGKQRVSGSESEIEMPGFKIMHPLSANKVRIMAGLESYAANVTALEKSAIVLEVDVDNKVNISSYKDMVVTQVDGDPDFPNIFKFEDDGYKTYKTFLLRYNYKSGNTTYEMKEELRLEYNPKNADEL